MYRSFFYLLAISVSLSGLSQQAFALEMKDIAPLKRGSGFSLGAKSPHFKFFTKGIWPSGFTCHPYQQESRHIGAIITTDKRDNYKKYAQEFNELLSDGFQYAATECDKYHKNHRRRYAIQSKDAPPPLKALHIYTYADDQPRYIISGLSVKTNKNGLEFNEFYSLTKTKNSFNGKNIGSCKSPGRPLTANVGLILSGPYLIEKQYSYLLSVDRAWKIEDICNDTITSINPFIKQGSLIREITLLGNVSKEGVRAGNKGSYFNRVLSKPSIVRHQGEVKVSLFVPDRRAKNVVTYQSYDMAVKLDDTVLAEEKSKAEQKSARAEQIAQSTKQQSVTGKDYYRKYFKHTKFAYTRSELTANQLKNQAVDKKTAEVLAARDGKKSRIVLTPHARSFPPIKSKGVMYSADDIVTLFNYQLFRSQYYSAHVSKNDVIPDAILFTDDDGKTYVASLLSPWPNYRFGVFTIEEFSKKDLQRYLEFDKTSSSWTVSLHNQQDKIGYNLECMMFNAISLATEALGCGVINNFIPGRLVSLVKNSKIPPLDSYFQHSRPSSYAFEFSTFGQYIFKSPLKDLKAHEIRIPLPSQYASESPVNRFRPREVNTSPAYWKSTKKAYLESFKRDLAKATDTLYIDENSWKKRTGSSYFHQYIEGISGRDVRNFKYITDNTIGILATYYTVKYSQCPASFNERPKEYQFGILTTVTTKDSYGWVYDKSYKQQYDDKFYIDRKIAPLFDKHLAIKKKYVSKTWRPNTFHATKTEKAIFNEAKNIFKAYGCDSDVVALIEENIYRDLALLPSLQEARFPVSSKM